MPLRHRFAHVLFHPTLARPSALSELGALLGSLCSETDRNPPILFSLADKAVLFSSIVQRDDRWIVAGSRFQALEDPFLGIGMGQKNGGLDSSALVGLCTLTETPGRITTPELVHLNRDGAASPYYGLYLHVQASRYVAPAVGQIEGSADRGIILLLASSCRQ